MTTSALDVTILERRFPQLARRRRGVVRAPRECHDDHRASFSVDLDKGVWYCHACARGGGQKAFAALVGERADICTTRPTRARPELEDYWHGISLWPLADVVRLHWRAARALREHGTRIGPGAPGVWLMLAHAARLDRESGLAEAALDAILAEGRLA